MHKSDYLKKNYSALPVPHGHFYSNDSQKTAMWPMDSPHK